MSDPAAVYFAAGRAAGLLFVAIALVSAELAYTCWRKGSTRQARGATLALALMALLQFGIGATLHWQVPQHENRVAALARQGASQLRTVEAPRVQELVRRFEHYRWVSLGLILLGVALVAGSRPVSGWRGFGLGLAPEAALMWLMVSLGQARAEAYLGWLLRP